MATSGSTASAAASGNAVVTPGETITASDSGFMRCGDGARTRHTHAPARLCADPRSVRAERGDRGHGTFVVNDQLVASVAGTVERVNKLISVWPLRARCVVPHHTRFVYLASPSSPPLWWVPT